MMSSKINLSTFVLLLRFGAVSAVDGLDSSKHWEKLKKKARAERFGTVKSVSADEEAKKKARLPIFDPAPVIESVEKEKKKARSLRFSEPKSSSKANREGNIDVVSSDVILEGSDFWQGWWRNLTKPWFMFYIVFIQEAATKSED